jgi:hypothetical protein
LVVVVQTLLEVAPGLSSDVGVKKPRACLLTLTPDGELMCDFKQGLSNHYQEHTMAAAAG